MEFAYHSRCHPVNTKILHELIQLRQQKAELLGFKNHAGFITQLRMAKNQENVGDFLTELAQKLTPLRDADLGNIQNLCFCMIIHQ